MARRYLPRPVFDVIDGGSDDEVTLRANTEGFAAMRLRPRALGNPTPPDLSTTVCGQALGLPIMLDPVGSARLVHRDAELAVARGAGQAGAAFVLSTVSSYPLEAVAEAATGPRWFQLYPPPNADDCRDLIHRAAAAGFQAMVVTVDGAVLGSRRRDQRHGVNLSGRISLKMVPHGLAHPRWTNDFLRWGATSAASSSGAYTPKSVGEAGAAVAATANPVTAETIRMIRETWEGPLLVKGVMRPDDLDELAELGVDGVIVSNHGGRQLNTVPGTIEVLADVVEAAGDRMDVLIDGGVRQGTDVIKALSLGAKAVLIGRPYLYALAVAGQRGVADVIGMLRKETEVAMALLGIASLSELNPTFVRVPPQWHTPMSERARALALDPDRAGTG
jgi:isopentenyl diphosphate isomerase/L-lactate dehydrogenase-like FMN-dependent dehydrogenase